MFDSMKTWAIQSLLTALLSQLDPALIRRFVDAGLDAVEDAVEASDNTLDDRFLKPLIANLRAAFDLPDAD